MYHISFIHLSVDGHLGCFHFLAIMNNAAVNIGVQVCVWMYVFISLGYIYLGVKLLDHMITLCCNLLRNYQTGDKYKIVFWLCHDLCLFNILMQLNSSPTSPQPPSVVRTRPLSEREREREKGRHRHTERQRQREGISKQEAKNKA